MTVPPTPPSGPAPAHEHECQLSFGDGHAVCWCICGASSARYTSDWSAPHHARATPEATPAPTCEFARRGESHPLGVACDECGVTAYPLTTPSAAMTPDTKKLTSADVEAAFAALAAPAPTTPRCPTCGWHERQTRPFVSLLAHEDTVRCPDVWHAAPASPVGPSAGDPIRVGIPETPPDINAIEAEFAARRAGPSGGMTAEVKRIIAEEHESRLNRDGMPCPRCGARTGQAHAITCPSLAADAGRAEDAARIAKALHGAVYDEDGIERHAVTVRTLKQSIGRAVDELRRLASCAAPAAPPAPSDARRGLDALLGRDRAAKLLDAAAPDREAAAPPPDEVATAIAALRRPQSSHEYWLTASREELLDAFRFQGSMTRVLLDEQRKWLAAPAAAGDAPNDEDAIAALQAMYDEPGCEDYRPWVLEGMKRALRTFHQRSGRVDDVTNRRSE